MTRRCSCAPLSENELLAAYGVPLHKATQTAISSPAAYSIGVRIEHDAEPCVAGGESVMPNARRDSNPHLASPNGYGAVAPPVELRAAGTQPILTRPVLTRLPRLTVVGAK